MSKLRPLFQDESSLFCSSFHFPSSWVVEIAQYAFNEVRDGTHDSPKDAEVGVPLVTSKNLINGAIDFSKTKTISLDDHIEISKRSGVSTGDLLFSMIGTIGNIAVVPEETNFSVKNVGLFRKNDALLSRGFAFYWLKSQPYQRYLEERQRGGNQKFVSLGILRESPVPIPPLAEQKVIADKLDTLLAQVETTKARLERIPNIQKRFRQSVLAAAMNGKLTEEWRNKNDVQGVKNIILDDVVESSFYGPRFGKNDYTRDGSGVPTIRTTDMKNGIIEVTVETPRVAVPDNKLEQFKANKNDLLITRTGSIGVMALFTGNYTAIPSAYLIRFRFKSDVNPKYIYFCLTSPMGQNQMGLSTTAITQPNINAKSIRAIELTLPSIEEQTEIVRRVEELFTFADTIEQKSNAALERVNNLTQSILAKAFRGELTADWRAANPELISGENSAEALLVRIKAEREALKPKKVANKKSPKRKSA